jgi:hypothetical protein
MTEPEMKVSPRTSRVLDLGRLAAGPPVEIAVDTEFQGTHTLTIQAATRLSERRLALQVYRSGAIPPVPRSFQLGHYLPTDAEAYGRYCDAIVRRRTALITADLSPVRLLADLLRLEGVVAVSRSEGRRLLEDGPPNATRSSGTGRWVVPAIPIALIGHFLPADFGRVFGRRFFDDLFGSAPDRERPLAFRDGKIVGLAYPGGSGFSASPVVEYALAPDGSLYRVRLETRDTTMPFDRGSLDQLSRTFLRLPKSDALSSADKRAMLRAFRERTEAAYGYAMVDAVNTLLVHEQMKARDAEIYRSFAVADADIPPMRPTLGGRVARFLRTMSARSAAGSTALSRERALSALMKKGGIGGVRRRPAGEPLRAPDRAGPRRPELQPIADPVLARGSRDAPGRRHVGVLQHDHRRPGRLLGPPGRPRAGEPADDPPRGRRAAREVRRPGR